MKEEEKKVFIRNNLDTIEALTPKRNIKDIKDDDDFEGELVINNKITFKSNGSNKNLTSSIENKQIFCLDLIKKIYELSKERYIYNKYLI